jgi:predicted TIM-barrel fold metal-dependent hydrolase
MAGQSLKDRMPRGAWDSHMHVIDLDKYPISFKGNYAPESHRLDAALEFESSVGIQNIVLVQPSFYGTDNSYILDVLRELGPHRARGVVQFDPKTTTLQQLKEWHELGVRGVRINVQSTGLPPENLGGLLQSYADAVRPLNWVVQIYVAMHVLDTIEPMVSKLNVRLCFDHMGQPDLSVANSSDPYQIPGFKSLLKLLNGGNTFVKFSAPYRLSKMDGYSDLDPLASEILRLKGMSRVVFATDWPHTRFHDLKIHPWIESVLNKYQHDQELLDRLFRGNAEDLWDVQSTSA